MAVFDKPGVALPLYREAGETSSCWSCGEMRAAHFCQACGKLQPALPTDFFSFFGLQRKLTIDSAELEREFYKLSRKLHPDLFARATSLEQTWSLEKSSQLNDAFRTLRDPIARTEYLLKLEGVQLEEQSQSATQQARETGGQKKQIVPPELLEEVFELNMQLEEGRMSKKMGELEPDLRRDLETTRTNLQAKHDALLDQLRGYWKDWDALPESATPEQKKAPIDKMLSVLNQRTYLRNLVRDVNEVLD